MKKYRKRRNYNIRNKKKTIIEITILTIAIILLSTHIVYAKYITVDKLTSTFNVAKPIFIVEGKETTQISEINNIGYYEFSIKNFNESSISEIGFLYTIEVISNTDKSIQFELYNEEEQQILLENLKTDELSIIGNEKVEQKYKLKVIYDSTQGNKGKNILEEVQVKVHSEQEKI
ncbi:MAG: hypothetical protein IJE68_05210 [Clostridia bacterium]|nr:hypothetical protein [Clostridia bacterium]